MSIWLSNKKTPFSSMPTLPKRYSRSEMGDCEKKYQRCRKCLWSHHSRDHCKKPDGATCDKCRKNHHRSLHNDKKIGETPENKKANETSNLNPKAPPFPRRNNDPATSNANVSASSRSHDTKAAAGLLPIRMIKGQPVEMVAMLDTGSNTSLLSKSAAKKLCLIGPQTHLTMNLTGGNKTSEKSEIFDIALVSPMEKNVEKLLLVHAFDKPSSSAWTVSKKSLEKYNHLVPLLGKLHLSGEKVDLLLGTDFFDGFVDIHVISGGPNEPIAKMNCFGWYVI